MVFLNFRWKKMCLNILYLIKLSVNIYLLLIFLKTFFARPKLSNVRSGYGRICSYTSFTSEQKPTGNSWYAVWVGPSCALSQHLSPHTPCSLYTPTHTFTLKLELEALELVIDVTHLIICFCFESGILTEFPLVHRKRHCPSSGHSTSSAIASLEIAFVFMCHLEY